MLVLLCVAMPLKYLFDSPMAVRIVGTAHGVLFMAYIAAALVLARAEAWGFAKLIRCGVASCLPFGTFIFERELREG